MLETDTPVHVEISPYNYKDESFEKLKELFEKYPITIIERGNNNAPSSMFIIPHYGNFLTPGEATDLPFYRPFFKSDLKETNTPLYDVLKDKYKLCNNAVQAFVLGKSSDYISFPIRAMPGVEKQTPGSVPEFEDPIIDKLYARMQSAAFATNIYCPAYEGLTQRLAFMHIDDFTSECDISNGVITKHKVENYYIVDFTNVHLVKITDDNRYEYSDIASIVTGFYSLKYMYRKRPKTRTL